MIFNLLAKHFASLKKIALLYLRRQGPALFGRWVEKANQPSLRRQRLWIGRLQAQRMQRSPRLGLLNSERLGLFFLIFIAFLFTLIYCSTLLPYLKEFSIRLPSCSSYLLFSIRVYIFFIEDSISPCPHNDLK